MYHVWSLYGKYMRTVYRTTSCQSRIQCKNVLRDVSHPRTTKAREEICTTVQKKKLDSMQRSDDINSGDNSILEAGDSVEEVHMSSDDEGDSHGNTVSQHVPGLTNGSATTTATRTKIEETTKRVSAIDSDEDIDTLPLSGLIENQHGEPQNSELHTTAALRKDSESPELNTCPHPVSSARADASDTSLGFSLGSTEAILQKLIKFKIDHEYLLDLSYTLCENIRKNGLTFVPKTIP